VGGGGCKLKIGLVSPLNVICIKLTFRKRYSLTFDRFKCPDCECDCDDFSNCPEANGKIDGKQVLVTKTQRKRQVVEIEILPSPGN